MGSWGYKPILQKLILQAIDNKDWFLEMLVQMVSVFIDMRLVSLE